MTSTILVEAAFGYAPTAASITWTDITQWVDLRQAIRITRGASDELSQTQAGTLGLLLDNTDGRFTAGNAAGPYYPYIRPSCPIRVSVIVGGVTYRRFYGMVTDWGQKWKGLQDTVVLTAVDLFALLGGDDALQALLVEEVLLAAPLAYFPLSEPASSTSAGDIAGRGAGSLAIAQAGAGGTLTFGDSAGPPADGLGAPTFTPASATAGKYLTGDMGPDFATTSSANFLFIEAWFTTSTSGRVILAARSDDRQYEIIFSLESGTGKLRAQWTTVGGPLSGYGSSVAATANLADGQPHHFVYDESTGNVYVDGGAAIPVSVDSMFGLQYLTVGAYANDRLWSGSISHIALHAPNPAPAISAFTAHYTAGFSGFSGEDADQRVLRLAGYAGIGAVSTSGDFSAVASQGEGGSTALEMMRQVETTEGGKLACDRGTASLVFQARTVRYNPTSSVTLAYADLETGDVDSLMDDQKLINTVTASRPGGATQRVASAESRTAFGPKRQQLDLLKTSDNEVLDAAYWTVSRYAVPQPEIRTIPVEAYSLPQATFQALLAADISTVITVTGMPATAPATTAVVTVEGYTETIGQSTHRLDYHTSRTNTDAVWVLDDPTYSVLGSTTRLAY
ncbi:hypothetical protein ACIGO8_08010 [Streptomyces sp. NPDC053493]|uniref:hypothetical protein n=1 Tax=Streptomyces sp. NPDC053493 TaxID=3365705 RepID=UPI0037D7F749